VVAKPVAGRTDPLLMTYAATGIGSLPFLVLLAAGIGGSHQVLATMPVAGWAALAHLIVPCTLLGFAGWFWALRHLPASTVSAFVFLNPPMTSLFGMIWGTEEFHWTTAVFGTITLAGVALSAGLIGLARRGGPASA
jgi:drug/metabolite transporter (DMT)-like permease